MRISANENNREWERGKRKNNRKKVVTYYLMSPKFPYCLSKDVKKKKKKHFRTFLVTSWYASHEYHDSANDL